MPLQAQAVDGAIFPFAGPNGPSGPLQEPEAYLEVGPDPTLVKMGRWA